MESNSRLCRVCSDAGHYDLSEMKFCCNDTDVLLIEAFNAFSELKNVSVHSNCLYDEQFKQISFFLFRKPLKCICVKYALSH